MSKEKDCERCSKEIDEYDYVCWHCGAPQMSELPVVANTPRTSDSVYKETHVHA